MSDELLIRYYRQMVHVHVYTATHIGTEIIFFFMLNSTERGIPIAHIN